jgi:hypothetical protein
VPGKVGINALALTRAKVFDGGPTPTMTVNIAHFESIKPW